MAVPALCFMVFALILPVVDILNASCIFYALWFVLCLCGVISYLLVQLSQVVTFKITELLAQPSLATAETTRRMMRYRWFLHPSIQEALWGIANICFAVPVFYPFDFSALITQKRGACFDQLTMDLIIGEFFLLVCFSLALAVQSSRIVDNFGLREANIATAKGVLLCVVQQTICSIGFYALGWIWILDLYITDATVCLPVHVFYYFNIIQPLHHVRSPQGLFSQRISVLSTASSSRGISTPNVSSFLSFLQHPDGYRAFLEFARMDLNLETLLARQRMHEFREAPSVAAAVQVYQECLVPQCLLATDIGLRWHSIYVQKKTTWETSGAVSIDAFEPVAKELLQSMFRTQFPRFLAQPAGVLAWHDFVDRMRALAKLDRVLTIVRKKSSTKRSV
ncbi:hypothetical protein AeRB84_011506 [Aphanomyces euteiches]|nr:hypothetical protein AeRB84_011506 [Aphanomyces euteiches]